MADQPILPIQNLTGGLATTNHPTRIAPDQSPDVLNFQFDRGMPAKRKGWEKVNTTGVLDTSVDFTNNPSLESRFAVVPHCGNDLDLGATFTVECVVRIDPTHGVAPGWSPEMLRKGTASATIDGGFVFSLSTGAHVPTFVYADNTGSVQTLTFSTGLAVDTTYHLAVVRVGTTITGYIDGVSDASTTVSAPSMGNSDLPLLIGGQPGPTSVPGFLGKMAEVRLWTVDRTASLLANIAKELATTDTSGLAGYWKLSEGSESRTEQNQVSGGQRAFLSPYPPEWSEGLITGELTDDIASGYEDFSLRFDGLGDFIKIPAPTDDGVSTTSSPWNVFDSARPGLRTWTVEVIIQPDCAILDREMRICQFGLDPSIQGLEFAIFTEAVSGDIRAQRNTDVLDSGTAPNVGAPTHIALTNDASNVRLYVDGVELDSVANSNPTGGGISAGGFVIVGQESEPATIGFDVNGFVGRIDSLRLWKVTRTAAEIAKYKDTLLPDDDDEDLVGYFKFNEGRGTTVKDSSSVRNNGTLFPVADPAQWSSGLVTPNQNPGVVGVYDYRKRGGVSV